MQPSTRSVWRAAGLAALLLLIPVAAVAQAGFSESSVVELPPPFLTVNQEQLLAGSAFGRRLQADLEDRSRALAEENRAIEADLIAEEKALTDARPDLPADEFRSRADAFDEKVQALRAAQDAKTQELASFQEAEQARFFAAAAPVLGQILGERGAIAVMDRRLLLVSLDQIDVTRDAIERIDQAIGDGGAAQDAPPVPETTPEPTPETAPATESAPPPETPPETPPAPAPTPAPETAPSAGQ